MKNSRVGVLRSRCFFEFLCFVGLINTFCYIWKMIVKRLLLLGVVYEFWGNEYRVGFIFCYCWLLRYNLYMVKTNIFKCVVF